MVALQDNHVVDIYDHDVDVAGRVAPYLAEGLERGEAAVVVATPEHLALFAEGLADRGVDVAASRAAGLLREQDAAALLDRFYGDGELDRRRFDQSVGELVRSAGRFPGVRIVGEMVDLLWKRGDVLGGLSLESVWNELGTRHAFSLYCCYGGAGMETDEAALGCLQEEHSEVVAAPPPIDWMTCRVTETFSPAVTSPRAARQLVADVLARWGLEDQLDAATMVVSELSTNAVLHAGTPFQVAVSRRGGALRIAVHDGCPAQPVPRAPQITDTGGRGLPIVARLARDWAIEPGPAGKTVWAELAVAS